MEKTEKIKIIESLLNGEHNLSIEQKQLLQELNRKTINSKNYGDLKYIATELAKILFHIFTES